MDGCDLEMEMRHMEILSEAVFAGVLLKIFFQKVLENAQENTNH